jgi:hypothetical protein
LSAIRDSFRFFLCARCKKQVVVCSHCDRGQIYCSTECSRIRRRETIRRAAKKYQEGGLGARNHARRQNRYRERLKKVTHQGSAGAIPSHILLAATVVAWLTRPRRGVDCQLDPPRALPETRYCHFCGCQATGFVRFSYLGSTEAPG